MFKTKIIFLSKTIHFKEPLTFIMLFTIRIKSNLLFIFTILSTRIMFNVVVKKKKKGIVVKTYNNNLLNTMSHFVWPFFCSFKIPKIVYFQRLLNFRPVEFLLFLKAQRYSFLSSVN